MKYVIFASYGNDSIALIQLAHEKKLKDVKVVYSDTGWAADYWEARILKGEALVKRKKGWPMGGGGAFCTAELKVKPALAWLEENDPEKESTCVIGVRREESANRATFPEWPEESHNHGGRELYAPLVRHDEQMRDALIIKTGLSVLPHRSSECFPCVHANIGDLRQLDETAIQRVERIETEMGINSKGNPRVMFRPKRHKGAIGVRNVVAWAKVIRSRDQQDLFDCDSGWFGK